MHVFVVLVIAVHNYIRNIAPLLATPMPRWARYTGASLGTCPWMQVVCEHVGVLSVLFLI